MFFRSALLVAGAGLAVAQSLSSNCTSALISVAGSQAATCLDLTLLAPLVLSNSSTNSVVPTVDSWLTGLCGRGPCSNSSLQAIVTNITNGCSSDLGNAGLPTNTTAAVTLAQEAYPTIRQIACLRNTTANTLCTTQLLTDVQYATGANLTLSDFLTLLTQGATGAHLNVPQNLTCSNCSKAAYSIASQHFPALVSGQQSTLQSTCGSNFTNGQIPSGIQETASNSSSSSGSGSSSSAAVSLSVNSLSVGAALLFAVSSAFAAFA